jgi:hypothetical protein
VQNVIAVLITFAFVFALGTTALFVVNRWERQHQSESQTPVDGFRIRRWRHRRRQVRIARRPVVDGPKDIRPHSGEEAHGMGDVILVGTIVAFFLVAALVA